ncbi:hypothetical protein STAS_26676 [Striga asiatica]|uniref:Uncharacterized protein n=1 Tax=Striga asiatica TaxID=4170 RepID=A0A5A7QZJ2_STRAF|nr:hypothetical protein STAS_26676 [Striga asiatica]
MQNMMDSKSQKDPMDIDGVVPRGSRASPCGFHENGTLYPVSANDSGEGLPYAPEDFPNPGDKWSWKVGKRIANSGFFLDRYLYLPRRMRQPGPKKCFASRLSLEQFVRKKFPDTDIDQFFASFSWKVPSRALKKGFKEMLTPPIEITEDDGEPRCKSGNKFCSSLNTQEETIPQVMSCDICCEEPGFCRACCCILCRRVIERGLNGWGYITCEAKIEGFTCGHSCHIECALRAYMAGTVGGSIGLDAEYYCRRCDSRTDMVPFVQKLLKNCESAGSVDDCKKMLRFGVCLLRGSTRKGAYELLRKIEVAMSKEGPRLCVIYGLKLILLPTRPWASEVGLNSSSGADETPQVRSSLRLRHLQAKSVGNMV